MRSTRVPQPRSRPGTPRLRVLEAACTAPATPPEVRDVVLVVVEIRLAQRRQHKLLSDLPMFLKEAC